MVLQDKLKSENGNREEIKPRREVLTLYEHPYGGYMKMKDMSELHQIKSYLASLKEHIDDKEEELFMALEWKALGMVIDRFMFCVSLVIVVIICVVFLFHQGTSAEYPVYVD